jgi:putative transposase
VSPRKLVRNKAVYVALGVRLDGQKEILGLWIEQTEGAKFWLRVMTELKTLGVEDVLIAVIPGIVLGGSRAFRMRSPRSFRTPRSRPAPSCHGVHLIRNSLDVVSCKDRRVLAAAPKTVYRATDAEAGAAALEAFADGDWGKKYPRSRQRSLGSWRRHWPAVIPFFAFPDDVRRIIYTTDEIEALNAKLRRAVRTRGHFPTDESAMKLLFLVLNLAEKEWKMPARE